MDLGTLIHNYLKQAKLMQVATSKGNQPWACTVYFSFDDELNLYWISTPDRRHSEEIRNNEKVAGTIVLPHTPGDKVRGVQFQGVAEELNDKDEAKEAMKNYAERYSMNNERVNEILENRDGDGHLPYKISPTLYVLFDELNFPEDPRHEYKL